MMGQRASMEGTDEGDRQSELDMSSDRSSVNVTSVPSISDTRNRLLEFARTRPARGNFLGITKITKPTKTTNIESPAFPGSHQMLYHDDLTPSCRLDYLLAQPKPDRMTMEAHAWNPDDRSLNIYVKEDDPLTLHRHPVAQSTDCIRGKVGYSKGFHVWKIVWPKNQRGTHAVVGVANLNAKLHSLGYNSLIGSTTDSYGFDIVRLRCSHDGKKSDSWDFPASSRAAEDEGKNIIPESFYCVLDMDEGYMAFATEERYLGVAFKGLKGQVLYPIVSAVWGHCEITINYMGGLEAEPPRLLAICRKTVRQHLGKEYLNNIGRLPVPPSLKNYLQFK